MEHKLAVVFTNLPEEDQKLLVKVNLKRTGLIQQKNITTLLFFESQVGKSELKGS